MSDGQVPGTSQSVKVDENFTMNFEDKADPDSFEKMTIEDIKKKFKDCQKEKADLHSIIGENLEKIKKLDKTVENNLDKIKKLQTHVEDLEGDLRESKTKLNEIANEKTDLNTTVEKLRELNRNYKARCESLARKNSEYEDLTEVNERLNRENGVLMERIGHLEAERIKKESMQIENARLYNEIREKANSEKVQELKNQISELEASKNDQQQKINDLLQEKKKMTDCNLQFQNVNKNLKRKIDSMNEEKDRVKTRMHQLIEDNFD